MPIVGHFDSLAEAQKLVQSDLMAGVVQETFEEGQLIKRLPVTTINSKSLLYNREGTLPTASFYDIHEQIPWVASTTFDQKEVALKRIVRQDILDSFMMDTYKNPNDYRTIILQTLRKGVMRTIEDKLIYGNTDSDSAEFDGIGHLLPADIVGGESFAAANPQAYDAGGSSAPLSMELLRTLLDQVRPKASILLMTRTQRNILSAVAFEKGIVLASATGSAPGSPVSDFGKSVDYFDGVPIEISDYLLDESDNTVNKDAGNDSGFASVWALRFGSILDGGLSLVTGGSSNSMDLFKMIELEALEDYDAGGIRLVAYCALAQGSSKATAVIHSLKESQVIVG